MRMYDLIEKKKRGGSLLTEEIAYMVRGFVAGDIPDYQMSAMLMAVYFKGMDDREITDLTLEMAHSGDMVDLSPIEGIKALTAQTVEQFKAGHGPGICNGYDIYCGICEAIFLAQSNGMGAKALTDLEEMVSRCLTYRFHEYDIPGTILY